MAEKYCDWESPREAKKKGIKPKKHRVKDLTLKYEALSDEGSEAESYQQAGPSRQGEQAVPSIQVVQATPRRQGEQATPKRQGVQTGLRRQGEQAGPPRQGGLTVPRRQGGQSVPRRQGGLVEPSRQGGQTGPRRQGAQAGPRQQGGQAGPSRQGGQAGPGRQGKQVGPRRQGVQAGTSRQVEQDRPSQQGEPSRQGKHARPNQQGEPSRHGEHARPSRQGEQAGPTRQGEQAEPSSQVVAGPYSESSTPSFGNVKESSRKDEPTGMEPRGFQFSISPIQQPAQGEAGPDMESSPLSFGNVKESSRKDEATGMDPRGFQFSISPILAQEQQEPAAGPSGAQQQPEAVAGPGEAQQPEAVAGPGEAQQPEAVAGPGEAQEQPEAVAGPSGTQEIEEPPRTLNYQEWYEKNKDHVLDYKFMAQMICMLLREHVPAFDAREEKHEAHDLAYMLKDFVKNLQEQIQQKRLELQAATANVGKIQDHERKVLEVVSKLEVDLRNAKEEVLELNLNKLDLELKVMEANDENANLKHRIKLLGGGGGQKKEKQETHQQKLDTMSENYVKEIVRLNNELEQLRAQCQEGARDRVAAEEQCIRDLSQASEKSELNSLLLEDIQDLIDEGKKPNEEDAARVVAEWQRLVRSVIQQNKEIIEKEQEDYKNCKQVYDDLGKEFEKKKDQMEQLESEVKKIKQRIEHFKRQKQQFTYELEDLERPQDPEAVVPQDVVQQPSLQQPRSQQSSIQQPSIQQPNIQQPSIQQPNIQQPKKPRGKRLKNRKFSWLPACIDDSLEDDVFLPGSGKIHKYHRMCAKLKKELMFRHILPSFDEDDDPFVHPYKFREHYVPEYLEEVPYDEEEYRAAMEKMDAERKANFPWPSGQTAGPSGQAAGPSGKATGPEQSMGEVCPHEQTFYKTITLENIRQEEPLKVNVQMEPRGIKESESRENIVCDVAVNVQDVLRYALDWQESNQQKERIPETSSRGSFKQSQKSFDGAKNLSKRQKEPNEMKFGDKTMEWLGIYSPPKSDSSSPEHNSFKGIGMDDWDEWAIPNYQQKERTPEKPNGKGKLPVTPNKQRGSSRGTSKGSFKQSPKSFDGAKNLSNRQKEPNEMKFGDKTMEWLGIYSPPKWGSPSPEHNSFKGIGMDDWEEWDIPNHQQKKRTPEKPKGKGKLPVTQRGSSRGTSKGSFKQSPKSFDGAKNLSNRQKETHEPKFGEKRMEWSEIYSPPKWDSPENDSFQGMGMQDWLEWNKAKDQQKDKTPEKPDRVTIRF